MFCLYTLPLARPAQAKIQMLTTRWRVIRSNLLSLIKFSRLYPKMIPLNQSHPNRSSLMYYVLCFMSFSYVLFTLFCPHFRKKNLRQLTENLLKSHQRSLDFGDNYRVFHGKTSFFKTIHT